MHPLLRTLDLTPGARTESSVHDLRPISQAAAARSHAVPVLLSLGLTPLLVYGLCLSLLAPASLQSARSGVSLAVRSVTLLLQEPAAPAHLKEPVRNLAGPEGPGGAGHREGTSTLDPRLAGIQTSARSMPTDAVDPDELSLSPRAERIGLSLNPALPLQAGGNGLARGTGRDAARGPGGLIRPPVPVPVPDQKLVPLRQVPIYHRLAPGEEGAATRQPVRVRILIGDDGVPFQATVVSGPALLHEEALRAAREWRFEPLGGHGLKAPVSLTLTFHPNLLRQR